MTPADPDLERKLKEKPVLPVLPFGTPCSSRT